MPTNQERIDFAMYFIEGAKEIAKKTRVTTARMVWKYCGPRLSVCAPRKCDDAEVTSQVIYRVMPETKKMSPGSPVLLMPLYSEDVAHEQHLQEIWESAQESIAYHRHGSNLIFLPHKRAARESPFIAGCCLLHEMGHELLDLPRRIARREQGDPLAEEVDMHTENYQLWREQDERRYDQLIHRVIFQIKKRWQRMDKKIFVPPERDQPWAGALEKILGSCPPELRYNRTFHLFIHAHFVLFDQEYPPNEAALYKRDIMPVIRKEHAPHVSASFPPALPNK